MKGLWLLLQPETQLLRRLWIMLLCLFILGGAIPATQSARAAEDWSSISSIPTLNLLQGVRYGGGEWLAMGFSATLLESSNGTSWDKLVPTGASDDWTDATHDGDHWILVGSGGDIYRSNDKKASSGWSMQTSGSTADLYSIAYDDRGTYIAVGDQGTILTSTDGVAWTSRSLPNGGKDPLFGIVYAEGLFVTVSSAGSIYTSDNGVTWTSRKNGANPLFGVQYGDDKFVAVGSGKIYFSDDGITWKDSNVTGAGDLYAVAYGNEKFVSVGANGKVLTSTNADDWSESETSGQSDDLYGIGYSADQRRFVTVGGEGSPVMLTQVRVSSDALSNLELSAGTMTPAFSSNVVTYTADVPDTTTSMTITPTAVESLATIEVRVNGGTFSSVPNGQASSSFNIPVGNTTIDVKVTSSLHTSKTYLIVVSRSEPNAPPTNLTLSNNQIEENKPVNTEIGTLQATDSNTGETFTYSLVGGDTSSFMISGNKLLSNEAFDYEGAKQNYSITILATDSRGATFSKVFTINLLDVNEPPVVSNSSKTGQEDTQISFVASDFTAFYDDPEKKSLQKIQVSGLPSNGTLLLNGVAVAIQQDIPATDMAKLSFLPNANWNGTTSFTWKGHDGNSYSAQPATFTLTFSAVNDLPTVSDFTKSAMESQTITFAASDFTQAFHDVDQSDTLTQIKVVSLPTVGKLKVNGTDVTVDQVIPVSELSTLNYSLMPGRSGTYSFDWLGQDGIGYSIAPAKVTLEITSVNDLPTVSDNSKSGKEDQNIAFTEADFSLGFTDADSDTLQKIQIVTLPANGTLNLKGTALRTNEEVPVGQLSELVFTPSANWSGTTSFTWKGHDGIDYSSNTANFTLQIDLVNDPPVVTDNSKSGPEDTTMSFGASDFTSTYTDVEGDLLQQVRIESLPTHGTLALDGTKVQAQQEILASDLSKLSFAPDANWNGTTSFSWNGSDGLAYSTTAATFTITITPVNDAPVANDGTVRLTQNQNKQGNVDAKDADGDRLHYQVVDQSTKGTVTLDPGTGEFTYTPQRNVTGNDSFTYVANDGTVDSNLATIRVTISAVVVPPIPVYGPTISAIADQTIDQGGRTEKLDFTVNDPDDDPRTLTVTAYSDNQRLVPNEKIAIAGSGTNRTIQVTSLAGQHGVATIIVTVSDGKSSASEAFTVTVKEVNHPPRALNGFLLAEKPEQVKGVLEATDEDGDALTFILVRQASKGKVTLTNEKSGTYTYTPDKGGTSISDDSFTFKVNDRTADSNTATVTISRKASYDATLQELRVSEGKLTPSFSSRRTSYAVKVSEEVASIEVTPTTTNAAASVTVNGEAVENGTASAPISLKPGNNNIDVIVKAQDGTQKTYKIVVEREYTPITEIKLEKHSLTMTEGDDPVVLAVQIKPDQDSGNLLVWKSSRTSVATVDETGTVVAHKKGTATITVSSLDGKVKDKATIKVEEGKIVQLVTDSTMLVMSPKDSEPIKIFAHYKQGTKRDVTNEVSWSTKNRKVASVTKGKIVANGTGSTLLTATFKDATVSILVKVYDQRWVDERELDLSLEESESPGGHELQIRGDLPAKEKLFVQVKIGKKDYDADVDLEENSFTFTHSFDENDELPENVQLIIKPSSSKKKEQIITLPLQLFDTSSIQVKELKKKEDKKKKSYSMIGKLYDETNVMKMELVEDDKVVAVGTIKRGKFEIPSFLYDGEELILRATSYTRFVQEWEVKVEK
ncbi:Ig-like domain-containing protein [Brevibacillus choshinensis]|uniref:tandem-95 repeat protein n=1 Tax=Brevibacillus choshinensis TaxID=54911 RepID=UPI002E1E922D|nr:Ig-like domain-containing protein [Brevibacillus choshinensis]